MTRRIGSILLGLGAGLGVAALVGDALLRLGTVPPAGATPSPVPTDLVSRYWAWPGPGAWVLTVAVATLGIGLWLRRR